jgi:hypothetical protein
MSTLLKVQEVIDEIKEKLTDAEYLDICNQLVTAHNTINMLKVRDSSAQTMMSNMIMRIQYLTEKLMISTNEINKLRREADKSTPPSSDVKVACECGLQICKRHMNRHVAGNRHRRQMGL